MTVVGVAVERRGRTGAAVAARLGASGLLFFLLRRRRRLLEEEEPAFEDNSDSSNRRRRSSMIASFDTPFESRSGMVVAVGEAFFADIVIRWEESGS